MLNDQKFWSNDRKVTTALNDAKASFSANIPYRMMPSAVSRTANVIVFSQHFITTFRLMLSSGDAYSIVQMSEAEREVYYSYIEYQDGTDPQDPEMLQVVQELDNCIVNEVECNTETYVNQAFNVEHSWDTCSLNTESVTVSEIMSQETYDERIVNNEIADTKMYIIQLESDTVKIYVGKDVIWEQ